MATANIKITALSDITSANMTYQDLLAVVDMNGTPETKKSTIQLVGNLILDGAGGSYFPAAAQSVLAQSVTNAAQPNITSTGTLTSLTVTGNVVAGNMQTGAMTATYFVGDGANLTNVPAGIPSGDGGNLSNLAGANVTGEVPFAAVANSVAVANVSGLGNIATVNLDGNASNILHGDGTWSADATDYSNANVVSLLAAFGSNTISTTGLITGDGGGLSNVPYANVTGTPTLGNISTIDIDGNSANYLDGTGTWGPLTVSLTGDGGNLSNIVGANVTGEVSFAATANAVAGANVSGEVGFAAVANSVALANVSGAGNIAGTNYDGNASNVLHGDGTWSADATDYSNANVVSLLAAFGSNTITTTGNISGGNFLTSGEANIYSLFVDAGGANIQGSVEINGDIANVAFVSASGNIDANNFIALSNFDGLNLSVTGTATAGQFIGDGGNLSNLQYSNIVGIGNVSSINLDGNVSNVLAGDGTWIAAGSGGTYGDSNVVTLLGSFGSNTITTTGLITGDGGGLSNVPYANVTGTPTLGNISTIDIDGNSANYLDGTGTWGPLTVSLTGDGGNLSNIVGANVTGEVSFAATANAVAGANVSGEVGFAAVANSVALANVSGAGNIAGTNYDGNASNVLHGDGTWSADATDYSNANVVSLLAAFGSNTITTTGNISGGNFLTSGEANIYSLFVDAGGANIQGSVEINGDIANVAFVSASGNIDANNFIALSNFDGLNLSVTGTATAGQFIGDGGNLSNLQYSNIVGIGNVSSINLDGNVSNVLAGDGTWIAAGSGGTYGDSNVVTLLGSFGSNTITTTGLITGDGGGLSNIAGANVSGAVASATTAVLAQEVINSAQPNIGSVGTLSELLVSNTIVSVGLTANTGNVTVSTGQFVGDGGSISNIAGANVTGEVGFSAVANSVAIANVSGAGNIATINLDGNVSNVLRGDGTFAADANSSYGDSNVASLLASFGGNAISTTANISAGNINANTNGFSLGYLEIPQVSLTADDTIALEDSGKHFHSNTAGNITLTIPTNATVAFPIGTAINIVEEAAGNILVNAVSGVSLYLAGNSTAANRVLGTYGMATILKTGTDTWFINGTGVS